MRWRLSPPYRSRWRTTAERRVRRCPNGSNRGTRRSRSRDSTTEPVAWRTRVRRKRSTPRTAARRRRRCGIARLPEGPATDRRTEESHPHARAVLAPRRRFRDPRSRGQRACVRASMRDARRLLADRTRRFRSPRNTRLRRGRRLPEGQPNARSTALTSSSLSGVTRGLNRASTSPSRPITNFSKFHMMSPGNLACSPASRS